MALASHFQFVTVELVFGTGVENSKNSTLLDCKPKVFHKKLHGGITPRDVCACFTMFDASQCGLGPFHMFASFTIFTLNVSLFVVLIEGRMGGWVVQDNCSIFGDRQQTRISHSPISPQSAHQEISLSLKRKARGEQLHYVVILS